MVSKTPVHHICLWLLAMVMCVPCSIAAEKTDKPSKKYWAYQKPQKPAVPQIEGNSSPNPIDAFIRRRAQGQVHHPEPSRQTTSADPPPQL